MRKVMPLGDRVVIEREKGSLKKGRILLPENSQKKEKIGKVIKKGPGKIGKDGKNIEINVKEGDRVIFSSYAGVEFEDDGRELLVVKEDDILAKLEG